ncbi:MAG: DUF3667 domain-containing protein [Planctomycetota bacterium]
MLKREEPESTEQAAPSAEHWTRSIGLQTHCLHCGHPRIDEFCGRCGQRHVDRRLEFWEWVKLTFSRITQLDRGVLYTFGNLLIHPGHVAKEYVRGRRKPYLNPLTCFFLGAAIQLLALWILEDRLRATIAEPFEGLAQGNKADWIVSIESRTQQSIGQVLSDSYIVALKQAYTYLALITMALPLAIFTRIGHLLSREKFVLAETMVWSLYLVSVALTVTAISNLVLIPILGNSAGILGIGLYFAIAWNGHRGFFKHTFFSRLVTLLAMACSIACFFPSLVLTFLATFVIRIALAG